MKVVLFIVLLSFSTATFGQFVFSKPKENAKYFRSLQLSMENGLMLGNGNEIGDKLLHSSYYNGLDIRSAWTKNNRENTYNYIYRYPTVGMGFYMSTFHNNEVGKPMALYFFFNVPLSFSGTRKWAGSYIGAFGMSYNFNPYDEVNNPNNIFIGSYRNCYLHMGYKLNYYANHRLTAFASVGFKHFSNGSFKQPNYGINLFPVGLGVKYNFEDRLTERAENPPAPFIRHNQWNIMLAAGSKNYVHGDPNYLKTTLGVNYLRQISYKYRMGVGMDFFYSAGSDQRNKSSQSHFSKSVSYAVVGSWEWVVNKVVYVPIGIGYYLHRNFENGEETNYYERVGLRFRMAEHYNLGLTIKAHGGAADMFEWSIVYTFHKDPNKYVL